MVLLAEGVQLLLWFSQVKSLLRWGSVKRLTVFHRQEYTYTLTSVAFVLRWAPHPEWDTGWEVRAACERWEWVTASRIQPICGTIVLDYTGWAVVLLAPASRGGVFIKFKDLQLWGGILLKGLARWPCDELSHLLLAWGPFRPPELETVPKINTRNLKTWFIDLG